LLKPPFIGSTLKQSHVVIQQPRFITTTYDRSKITLLTQFKTYCQDYGERTGYRRLFWRFETENWNHLSSNYKWFQSYIAFSEDVFFTVIVSSIVFLLPICDNGEIAVVAIGWTFAVITAPI
jgi:hypothetical protein